MAICKAEVVSQTGQIFTDIGDASPTNCNSKVAKHLLRMASTRAIARALRSFTNIGMTALEELADLYDVTGKKVSRTRSGQTGKPAGKTKNDDAKNKQKTKASDQKKQEPVKDQTENPAQ